MLLTFPVTVHYGLLHLQLGSVRQEVECIMQKGIEENDLVLLKFTTEQSEKLLKWEHPGEFAFQGMMYDVYETKTSGDTISYLCWPDQKETELNKQLAALSGSVIPQNMPFAKELVRVVIYAQTPFLVGQFFQPFHANRSSAPVFPVNADHYQSVQLTPPDPPPKFT
jgi:hypothetical protein